jgi:hypothetical protein
METRNSKTESEEWKRVAVILSEAKNLCSCFIAGSAEILRIAQNDRI